MRTAAEAELRLSKTRFRLPFLLVLAVWTGLMRSIVMTKDAVAMTQIDARQSFQKGVLVEIEMNHLWLSILLECL